MKKLDNARRLKAEADSMLRTPIPSPTNIKLLVADLVDQFVVLAEAVEKLESEISRVGEVASSARIGF